jgi:hypothetical protein
MLRAPAFYGLVIAFFALSGPAFAATKEVGPIVSNVVTALPDQPSIPMDASTAFAFSLTLGGNRTIENPVGLVAGSLYTLALTQDGTGSRILSYGNAWRFNAATPPTLSTAPTTLDILLFYSDGTHLNFLSISKDVAAPISAPSSLVASTDHVSECVITWTDHSDDETQFDIEFFDNLLLTWGHLDYVNANVTTYTDSGVAGAGDYKYRVRAKRGATLSSYSNEATCTAI